MDIHVNILTQVCKHIISLYPKLKNLWERKNLTISIQGNGVTFYENSKEINCGYICLIIRNASKETISLYPKGININGEPYSVLVQGDRNFQELGNRLDHCNSEVYQTYKEKWSEIHSENFCFKLAKDEERIFPINIFKENSRFIVNVKKNSLLFFNKNKRSIVISIGVNRNTYEYGVNRRKIYEACIKYLAFYNSNCTLQ